MKQGVLRLTAWLSLIGGVIFGVFSIAVAVNSPTASGGGLAILIGLVYILSALLTWALLSTVADTAESLEALQRDVNNIQRQQRLGSAGASSGTPSVSTYGNRDSGTYPVSAPQTGSEAKTGYFVLIGFIAVVVALALYGIYNGATRGLGFNLTGAFNPQNTADEIMTDLAATPITQNCDSYSSDVITMTLVCGSHFMGLEAAQASVNATMRESGAESTGGWEQDGLNLSRGWRYDDSGSFVVTLSESSVVMAYSE